MVIWEITLGTAYFLGLKRTYRLALKLQRRLVSPSRPKLRQFLHRRTRAIFNVATNFHKKIQARDKEVGRNLGNWILLWRDKLKSIAQDLPPKIPTPNGKPNIGVGGSTNTLTTSSSNFKTPTGFQTFNSKTPTQDADTRNINFTSSNILRKPFFPIAMMMQTAKPVVGNKMQSRYISLCRSSQEFNCRRYVGSNGVIRDDIRQWMLRN